MNINTRDMPFVEFNGQDMPFVEFNGVLVYESWKNLIASGVPPLTLLNCKGVDLVDYKLYGNSVQEQKIYPKLETLGFLPASGTYPTTNTTYPNATYEIIPIKAGQRYDFNYYGEDITNLRLRCIYNGNIIGDVGYGNLGTDNIYFTTTIYYGATRPQNGYIIAKQDLELGLMYLIEKSSNFKLEITSTIPTPEEPIEVESVGEYDETTGKYKIPIITRSKNILPFPYKDKTKTQAGVTWNVNNDRSVTISGTPTGYSIFTMVSNMEIENNTDYTFNLGLSEDADNLTLDIWVFDSNKTQIYSVSGNTRYESGRKIIYNDIHIDGMSDAKYITIQVKRTLNNTDTYGTFKPTLEKGNVDTSYDDYVEPITTNIFLNEPLRKAGDYADYIDFAKQKVFRNVEVIDDSGTLPINESLQGIIDNDGSNIELPNIPTIKGTTVLEVGTKTQPSNLEVVYKGKEVKE